MNKNGVIFYFSGTGNSLHAAKKIAEAGDYELRAAESNMHSVIDEHYSSIGFVFPVYFLTVPPIMAQLISSLQISGNPHLFAIATCNASPGNALADLRNILSKKGKALTAAFNLTMPGNTITVIDLTQSAEEQLTRLHKAETDLATISRIIQNREKDTLAIKTNIFNSVIGSIMNLVLGNLLKNDKLFTCNSSCTKCGLCVKICPTNAISISEKITRNKKCAWCFGCFHLCPQKAIETGKASRKNMRRYKHPQISVSELYRR